VSKSKCTGACCEHVANMLIPAAADSRYEYLTKRIDESKKLAELYRELGIIHGQYAEDVDQLLFEVSAASMSAGLVPLGKMGDAGKMKSAVKKARYDLA